MAASAADRRRLRASDDDRDQVAALLNGAFVQGRLTKAEFDLRVTQVFASRTFADLDALTADIPAGRWRDDPPAAELAASAPPVPRPAEQRSQPNGKKLMQRGTAVGAGVGLVVPVIADLAVGGPPVVGVIFGVVLSALLTVFVAGFLTLLSWVIDRDSGRQSAQGPGAPGDAAGSPAQIGTATPRPPEQETKPRPGRTVLYSPGVA
jgi:hypothetical protein